MITIKNHTFADDTAVVGYMCGSLQTILNSDLSEKEKLAAIQELKNDVDFGMMMS
jgi:hypothetical protein